MLFVFVLLFSVWVALTVAVQFNSSFTSVISRYDVLCVLPRWTFFAPNPAHTDIRVLVRFGRSSSVTSWNELWLSSRVDECRTSVRGLFNPYRRLEKFFFDFRNVLTQRGITLTEVRTSSEYIALLAMSEMVARALKVEKVQFMLAETNYTLPSKFKVIMISDMHTVTAPDQL